MTTAPRFQCVGSVRLRARDRGTLNRINGHRLAARALSAVAERDAIEREKREAILIVQQPNARTPLGCWR